MVKRIDHIAIAVNDIDDVARFYTDTLKLDLSGVEVVIELVQPASDDSPLVKFLETRGPGIHHICFEVEDIQKEVEELKKRNTPSRCAQYKGGIYSP
jgi:methylmalonyl-CoA epimerase